MSAGAAGTRYASVAVPVPVRRLFTYAAEEPVAAQLAPGVRVRVPFGRRKVAGTVVEWPAAAPDALEGVKLIDAVLPGPRRVSTEVLALTRFVADYYLCSWGEAIEAALPPDAGRRQAPRAARRAPGGRDPGLPVRAPAQQRLWQALPADGSALAVSALDASARRALPALVARGLVEIVALAPATGRAPSPPATPPTDAPLVPTADQARVLAELMPGLDGGSRAPFLLFGATGSGKTEVYFQAAERVLEHDRGVIYLVPEIGLTALLIDKVTRRFGARVALLHSGLAGAKRFEEWERVRTGAARLVVGTRSAIFAPVRDLGLIVVDEEQDHSYKQEESPRYNARDLAVVRARDERAALILGSATPSLESFHHAREGRYRLLRLGGRIERRPLPEVRIVDMRQEYQRAGDITPLSRLLVAELERCLARGEQALVLRNRRGWAASLYCPRCGNRFQCPNCSISLTWHRAQGRLRCHYCGVEQHRPDQCGVCRETELKLLGEGTERIEELIAKALPTARIERMDRDTVRGRGAHARLLQRFDRGEIDILVGTQMIAKGHDFPRVTVVGVLAADQALGLPDFRAAERVFQLLTQVAGRAGRGERPGRVVVQVYEPDHPVVKQAAQQDYEAFYVREIAYRRALRYPPLSALVQLVIQDQQQHRARRWAERVAEALARHGERRLQIAGPGPAPIERLKGRYRQQILVRAAGRRRLIAAVERALAEVEGEVPRRALVVDVDPLTLL